MGNKNARGLRRMHWWNNLF